MTKGYLERTTALMGEEAVNLLQHSCVAVFGLGGVGGYAVESLARSGIGKLILVDSSQITESNINRQIIATSQTIGKDKTQAFKKRLMDIRRDLEIEEYTLFYKSGVTILSNEIDFVIDAMDTVSSKLALIESCNEKNIPIISCMGTGNKMCPEKLKIDDIYNSYNCPLARVMRRECRKRGIDSLDVVFSEEIPKKIVVKEEGSTRNPPASSSFVPPVAGLLLGSFVVRQLIGWEE